MVKVPRSLVPVPTWTVSTMYSFRMKLVVLARAAMLPQFRLMAAEVCRAVVRGRRDEARRGSRRTILMRMMMIMDEGI